MTDRPKLCAQCGKLMGVGDVCPYCGADNRKLSVRLRRLSARVADQGGPVGSVSAWLVGIFAFLFMAALAVGGVHPAHGGFEILTPDMGVLYRLGLQDNGAVAAGQWWRVVTAIFLHLGLVHFAFNAILTWQVGRMVESEFGGRLMLLTFLASGILGFVGSYFAHLGGGGASGGVSGLMGAILVRRWLIDGNLRHPWTVQVLFLVVLNALLGLSSPVVNNVAHGVGFATGAALAFVLTRVPLKRLGAIALMLVTSAVVGVTVVAFAAMLWNLPNGSGEDLDRAVSCWLEHVQPAVARDFNAEEADRAVRCLGDLPRLEPRAGRLRDEAKQTLGQATAAWDEGDDGGLRRAVDAVRGDLMDFATWVNEAAPRYPMAQTRSLRVR